MLASILLAAALFGNAPQPDETTKKYRCEGGPSLSVTFEKGGVARVFLGGGAYRLKAIGNGRWADGQGQELVVDDQDATWTSGVDGVKKCEESDE
jgi:hypothetical protein